MQQVALYKSFRTRLAVILVACAAAAAQAEERKFAVMLAVPTKSMPGFPGTPLPNPNDIHDHYFDFSKPGITSFAEYWHEISYGNVHVTGRVLGWVEVPWPVLPPDQAMAIGFTSLGGLDGGEAFNESRQMYLVDGVAVPGLVDGWWTPGERFLDVDENGAYDSGEPFEDFMWIWGGNSWVRLETQAGSWGRTYIENNYPGDVQALLSRTGNNQYDGPDAWTETGNTKLIRTGNAVETTPEPEWYGTWWAAYWEEMHVLAGVTPPAGTPAPPIWITAIPRMAAFEPPPGALSASGRRPFAPTHGSYDPEEDADKLIYPDAHGYYDGRAEYSDMPSSMYHARSVSGLNGGGDGRLGEVTSPRNQAIHGQDFGRGNPANPGPTDKIIPAGGPLAYNVHGTNGYDAGNVANLEYLTWLRSGTPTFDGETRRPEILKRDYNLDGLLDQGSCRDAGTENYARDGCPCGGNDGNPSSEAYPFNRQRLMEDVIAALDSSVDWNELVTDVTDRRYVFGTMLLPAGVCPPGIAPGGRGLFQLPAPAMDLAVRTRDWPVESPAFFSDFATAIDGTGDTGQSDATGYAKALLSHEYLHVWEGYPDLYDYDVYSGGYINHPVGVWDIMAAGWVHPAPILKQQGAGGFSSHAPWLEVTDLTSILRPFEPTPVTLADYAFHPAGSAYFYENPRFPGERFYFWRLTRVQPADHRRINFSRGLPGDGMMIMHTDLGSNPNGVPPQNRLGSHFTYNIIQADGLQQLEHGENMGDDGDPWPGVSDVRSWHADTDPSSRWWNGAQSGLSITDIQEQPEYSVVTFLWKPRLVPELQFIRPPGGKIVNGQFVLQYEVFDLYGGTTIEFYTDNDSQGYDGVRLNPTVAKGFAGSTVKEFQVPLGALQATGRNYFYARLIPGMAADGRSEPPCSIPRAASANRGRGRVVDAAGTPDRVSVDIAHSKLESWTVTCVDDSVPGAELWEVKGTLSGALPELAVTGTVFSAPTAGIALRIDWTGHTGVGMLSNLDGNSVLEVPAGPFVASEFQTFDTLRIVSGPLPGVYRIDSVLSSTRLRLDGDAGSGAVEYRLHSFKAEDLLGPPDRFTFLTTGKTAYSRPINIVAGRIVPEIYPVITTAFRDEASNPAHRAPVTVLFDASESRDELGNENPDLTYLWDFGDGTTSTQRRVEHTYDRPFPQGVVVTLVVTNPDPYDDPLDPVPPPPFLAGVATTELVIPTLSDGLEIVFERATTVVPEGGTAGLSLKLSGEPPREVTVTAAVDSGNGRISVLPPGSVTFTRSDWDTWQQIVLFAEEDVDASNREVVIRCTAPGLFDALTRAIEEDNDLQAIVPSTMMVHVPEGGSSGFDVKLAAEPDDAVTVNVEVLAGNSSISLASADALTFTPADWDVGQQVRLSAAEDLNAANRTATVVLSSPGVQTVEVTAMEVDNDVQAIVLDLLTTTVLEGGTSVVHARLAAEPEGDVVVHVAPFSGDPDISVVSGERLTFTVDDWDLFQPVTLAAREDDDAADGTAVVRFEAQGIAPTDLVVVEQDNDILGIAVLNSPVFVPEGGTAELRLVLTAQPLVNAQVHVVWLAGDRDISVQPPGSVTFTPADWNVPQSVTLAAAEDLDAMNHSATLRCWAAGMADRQATAIEQDNDVQAVLSDVDRVSVPENGKTTVRLKLAAEPESNMTVTTIRASGDTDISVLSGASLVFTPSNWNVYQLLTLAAALDADRLNGQAVIRSSAPGALPCEIIATEVDNTPLFIIAEPGTVIVPETGSATFSLRLNAQPDGDLPVHITRTEGDADLTNSPSVVTFTQADWNVPQPVTLSAAKDPDGSNGQAIFRCSAVGALPTLVTAVEQDSDTQQIVLEKSTVTVPEGGQAGLRVRLALVPESSVLVYASFDGGDRDLTVSTPMLIFTKSNWNIWQSVIILAAEDLDAENGGSVLSLRAAGVPDATAQVWEQDNDRQAILCLATLTVPEDGVAQLAVTLQAQPVTPLTVTAEVVSGDTDLYVQAGRTLVFTSSDWHLSHMVTVGARKDADKVHGTAELRLSAPGVDARWVTLVEQDSDANLAPLASDASVIVAHGSSRVIQLAAEDPDQHPESLTYVLVSQPAHGQIVQWDARTGEAVYLPEAGYAGLDALTFRVSDGIAESNLARITLVVQAAVQEPGEPEPPPQTPDDSGNPVPGEDEEDPDEIADPGDPPANDDEADPTGGGPVAGVPPVCGAGLASAVPLGLLGWLVSRSSRRRRGWA